jgi:hypothetical protein
MGRLLSTNSESAHAITLQPIKDGVMRAINELYDGKISRAGLATGLSPNAIFKWIKPEVLVPHGQLVRFCLASELDFGSLVFDGQVNRIVKEWPVKVAA